MSFEADPQRTHEKRSLKYCEERRMGKRTEKEDQAAGSEAGRTTQRIFIINYNMTYNIALQLYKDLCLGSRAYKDT